MLEKISPSKYDVILDIVYATNNNFTGNKVYSRIGCYLHSDAIIHLRRAIDIARVMGLKLKIYDAFRPSEAQWILWESCSNSDFLSDPRRGSPHSMGVAVDLTLVDEFGKDLNMGTSFDDFTSESFHGCLSISREAQVNRAILLGIMTAAGWDFFQNEWWHYQLFNAREKYPVLSDKILDFSML